MHIAKMISFDIWSVASLVRRVIEECSYYTPAARSGEIERYREHALTRKMSDARQVQLVARNGLVKGFLGGNEDCGTYWLDWVVVDPTARRQGVASLLVGEFERVARSRGAQKVWCDTRTDNRESIALFERLGYSRIAELKTHWYGLDFLLWERRLS